MGDGGVTVATSQLVLERFPVSEALCGGNTGPFLANSFKQENTMKGSEKGEDLVRETELCSDKVGKLNEWSKESELEKGELVQDRHRKGSWEKESSKNGELENDGFFLEKVKKGALEKGGIFLEKSRNGDVELGEFIPERGQKGECLPERLHKLQLEKGDITTDRWKKSGERSDSGSGRGRRGELEKRDLTSSNLRKADRERSPENGFRKKDGGNYEDQRKRDSLDGVGCAHERDSKKSLRAAEDELGQHEIELCNEKSRDKKHYSESWSKRSCGSRKYHADLNGHSRSKSQRKSEESNRCIYPERVHGNASSSSSRVSSSSRNSSRHHDSSVSSRSCHHRQGRSPGHGARSIVDRRDRTPVRCQSREKGSHHYHRERTPGHTDRSPHERARHHDHRDRASGLERSPRDRRRTVDHREHSKRKGECDKKLSSRHEEMVEWRDTCGKDMRKSSSIRMPNESGYTSDRSANDTSSKKKMFLDTEGEPLDLPPPPPLPLPPPLPAMPPPLPPQPEVNVYPEVLSSMEEDMDICDTPPHATAIPDTYAGKWFYLNHFGVEQGPSRLADLKQLVEEGILLSDHLIKHSDSDRWVTVENASSPLVLLHLPSVVSDTVTQMVSPPEAPGNLLMDTGESTVELLDPTPLQKLQLNDNLISSETIEDLHIDDRVEALFKGYSIVDGKELETVGEALNANFEYVEWENWSQSEGFTRFQVRSYELFAHQPDEGMVKNNERLSREAAEIRSGAIFEEQSLNGCSDDWFAGRWSCKGGDWKRNDEAGSKKKLVLNQGYPLCDMPKCGHEDPRWYRRDDLYYPSRIKKLDLPTWAFSFSEDNSDGSNDTKNMSIRSGPVKALVTRGVKGTIQSVVRINARVVKDHDSFEPLVKVRDSERHTLRSTWSHSSSSDRVLFHEGPPRPRRTCELDSQSLHKCRTALNIPRDHVCTVHELSLNLGKWHYLDGAGHEHGPFNFEELKELISRGKILENTSVFRKLDNTWVPISRNVVDFEAFDSGEERNVSTEATNSSLKRISSSHSDIQNTGNSFHCLHPQFIGYMRGKLHELVMKSYKNREFAAAINEVLDPWISAKQPKKESDRHFPFNSSITRNSANLVPDFSGDKLWKSEDRPGKRARLQVDESDEFFETEEDLFDQKNDHSFEELCGVAAFTDDSSKISFKDDESWGLLNGQILARVFHFLRSDMKALASSAATCKRWNAAVNFYKHICRHVDVSSFGTSCSDTMIRSIMNGYDRKNLTSVCLTGCSNISAGLLEEVLLLFPSISSVFTEGCNQFNELKTKFQNINWIMNNRLPKNHEDSHSKIKSLKQITDKSYSVFKGFRGLGSYLDDSFESGDFGSFDSTMVDMKDSSGHVFRHGFYKRAKLFDSRKPPSVLSRDVQMRNWVRRKTETGYRKLEEYVKFSLKNIMKGNSSEFFIPKVAEIEDRMRRGYYVRHGLGSLKDDISRMCRDALKAKNRGDSKEMKHIILLLIRLARSLERNPRLNNERDEAVKTFKDGSESGLYLLASKHKKIQNKVLTERKGTSKSNSLVFANGGIDSGAFDREIKRSLSKLKNKNMNSDSETSDDHENDFSEDDDRGEDESSASDTESDLELHASVGSAVVKGSEYFMMEDTFDTISDDREWGARMTKASLVPPVTRKYEVIDKYLVIADEEEVKRKMRVTLPDGYSEKLFAQKSGIEESDLEIPEVKEYKPRKLLGVEVLEQEVYGIDPYTYNLLLDSIPDEPDWPLVDKHRFIEEVLLRALNKQVRHFTGSGNTPMIHPLRPVIEEIQTAAEEDGDKRIVKLCNAILKAIHSRPVDNYVAYRKGLGVVCNKEEGFSEDDFIVEFLGEVYPSWKWFEKQDGIRSLQKNSQEQAPEFYNIYLERPKGDRDGYDLVVVDAMHKANYASRICHSCRPNCEAKVTAVDGQYQIGIYSLRPIAYGEEITFDYNSVTESKEEYEASVCLCGNHVCRGSYLNLAGEGAFQKVLMACHGVLDRHKLILEACEANSLSQEDYMELGRAGVGTCLLDGLPDWLITYSAHLLRFINFERTKLPDEILKHNVEEKKKFFTEICLEVEKNDALIQAEGVYNARLQNMAITLDKLRYVMRRAFGDPKKAPPPVKKLGPEALVSILWKGEGSLVEELLQSMTSHMEPELLNDLKSKIQSHDPSSFDNIQRELRKSLLWLRDELRNLPCTPKCRHDAAADLIHMYAYTKCFFKVRAYKCVTSPPVYISPLDLGPKYANKMGSGFQEYCKTYGENYCLGQLLYWHSSNSAADPDYRLARARRGCLSLPDISSFYGKSHKPVHERVYDSRTVRFMLSRMEKQPQRPWPKDRIWVFKSNPEFFGSPMLDAALNKCPLDKEMVQWLKSRPNVYQGT